MKDLFGNIKEYPLIPIFAAVTVLTLAGYLFGPEQDFSEMENRFLQKRPAVTASSLADGSFMDAFEVYTNEQIPLRGALVKCRAAMVYLTGASENDGIAKGRDGYLFDKVLSVSDRMDRNAALIASFAENAGRDVYVAAAPTSTWINADRLPAGMPVLDEESCREKLEGALSGTESAHFIDLYPVLCEHAGEQLYYRTDHHWTTAGAGYAYSAIASAMGLAEDDIRQYEKHEAGDFRGTHYAKYKGINVEPDTVEYYDVPIGELVLPEGSVSALVDTDALSGYDKYAAFMHGNRGKMEVHADKGTGADLVIFKDSYANCLIPYLVMNYDNITVIDLRYFGGSAADELTAHPDADVLLLYNYTFLNDDNHFYKLVDR
ncbi:MAG: hypothetical protein K6G58_09035 [Lachnospiraceae bacterium]|nr:hypothetical protein [Lachnospiraceae bacterium]